MFLCAFVVRESIRGASADRRLEPVKKIFPPMMNCPNGRKTSSISAMILIQQNPASVMPPEDFIVKMEEETCEEI